MPQIIDFQEIFNDFFACKIVLAATHHNSENVQKLFSLQNCRSRKSAISRKHSNIFPPAKMSQQQPINILKTFKNFFGCKNVVAANHLYPGNIQRLFRLQKCHSSNPSKFSKYSKALSPTKLSQPQNIYIVEKVKDFFACKVVLSANHRYPGIFKDVFACKNFLAATHHYSEKIQRVFRLQNCLSRKSSISWKQSKSFSPANLPQPQIIDILEMFKDFLPVKLSQQQPINALKIFKDFFACKIVLAANHRYPGNIQRHFRLQKCLSSNPSIF